jgi:hypothetical protein
VYQKSFDVADGLGRRGFSVVAPWEVTVHNPSVDLIQGSDLVLLMENEGVSLDDALELNVRVVSLGGSRQVAVQGGQKVLVGADHLQPAEIRVNLRSIWTKKVLMELVTEYVEDPLSEDRTVSERLPALAEALALTLDAIAARLVEAFGDARPAPSTAVFAFNPKPMFDFRYGESPPLRDRFVTGDPMETLAGKLCYYQYFDPDITVDRVIDFERLDAGLLVEDPGEFASRGLKRGDFIARIGPTVALGSHVLLRQTRVDTGKSLALEVLRDGTKRSIVIASPTGARSVQRP